MNERVRVEVRARNDFWRKAIRVEWEHQFPDRELEETADGYYLLRVDWVADFQAVAKQCLSEAVVAPADPSRRLWFRRFVPRTPPEE